LLALLGGATIVDVSRLRVKQTQLRKILQFMQCSIMNIEIHSMGNKLGALEVKAEGKHSNYVE
jgi:hypothetical protein